ncbi:DUF1793-domain-containing protein [Schizopora paradoxa]|uniref:DUF1793-domain-containing protein n=1 Tax=Schizopora paradoxa TaxID=27342 RepID=A0A0H2RF96_9AGAM|nr:DUF1793-domain-containing protein [Schizopora paradoxa]
MKLNHPQILFRIATALTIPQLTLAQLHLGPAWPLAVKNPFLNTWYQLGSKPDPLSVVWPMFWNPSVVGWFCDAVVDDIPYRLMGAQESIGTVTPEVTTQLQITPTQTIIPMQAGPVNITMTFLSPITATDLSRQSLPFSYFFITATSADGLPHAVRVYSDITAEWIGGDTNLVANATGNVESDVVVLQASLQTPRPFSEINDHAQDAIALYAMKNTTGVHYQVETANFVRNLSISDTDLQNTIDTMVSTHAINNPFNVWGISADLGQVINTTSPVVWAVGVMRDPAIQFTMLSGDVQLRNSYYRMNFTTAHDMASFFLDDFENTLNKSTELDLQIMNDTANISTEYYDLLTLVSRQAMSALEITVAKDDDGNFNSSDIMAFLKNMGGVGNGGVNAVDVLYAAFPIYLYFNPAIGSYLLKPLFISQDSPQYTQPYAAQGLGVNFPNASIENIPHGLGIEQSGNMIIMLLAHLQASGDATLVTQHYDLIKNWTDYLVENSLDPNAQQPSPSDGISAINQTNLALKGIIGIEAMARISSFVGMNSDAEKFQSIAESYIGQWQNLSLSLDKTHLLTSFGQESSAGLIYNIYADKLLQLDLIPQSVYDTQNSYLSSQLDSNSIGIPLDSTSPKRTRADWMMFAGAASGDEDLERSIISMVHSYALNPTSNTPLSPVYDPTSGNSPTGTNSPAMGAMFAPLALRFILLSWRLL